jgi:hypothetical protein
VDTTNPLEAFLYLLMRDHLPVGEVEKLVQSCEDTGEDNKGPLSNGWLAKYAEDLARRLRP